MSSLSHLKKNIYFFFITDENMQVAIAVLPFLLKSSLHGFIYFITEGIVLFLFFLLLLLIFACVARCGIVLYFSFKTINCSICHS